MDEISTWHTNQPEDDERFHRALKAAFEKLGPAIYFEHFRQAMTDLARDYTPTSTQHSQTTASTTSPPAPLTSLTDVKNAMPLRSESTFNF